MLKKIAVKIDQLNTKKAIVVFLLVWLIVNLLQAYFTELHADEAYYWMYSRNLDWGYFDHPPMVALLIKAGYWLFPNEFGVRLFVTLMGTFSIFLVYKILEDELKSFSLFLIIIGSVLIIKSHVGGFLAIPDLPVVFFTTLFFYVYKKYSEKEGLLLALILGITGAAMLYSKYHGILVLIFTLFSNFKLLRKWTFWIIPIVIVLLLIPHIVWQFSNNFPTLEYHLVSRSSPYKIDHTINYLYSQLLISGPFSGIILLYFSFKSKVVDTFSKALKYNLIGFLMFFLLMSFKGHVEAHWTAIAYVPLVILSYKAIGKHERVVSWLRVLYIPTLFLLLFARLCLVFEILPREISISKEFHRWDIWAKEIKEKAQGRRVVFINSFQNPSKYAFYSKGEFSTTLNNIRYRKNQYDLWKFSDSIQNRRVLLIHSYYPNDTLEFAGMKYPVQYLNSFHSYYQVPVIVDDFPLKFNTSDTATIQIKVTNPGKESIKFIASDNKGVAWLSLTLHDGERFQKPMYLQKIDNQISSSDSAIYKILYSAPEKKGEYIGYFSIVNDSLYPSFNSKIVKFTVK